MRGAHKWPPRSFSSPEAARIRLPHNWQCHSRKNTANYRTALPAPRRGDAPDSKRKEPCMKDGRSAHAGTSCPRNTVPNKHHQSPEQRNQYKFWLIRRLVSVRGEQLVQNWGLPPVNSQDAHVVLVLKPASQMPVSEDPPPRRSVPRAWRLICRSFCHFYCPHRAGAGRAGIAPYRSASILK